MNREEELQLLRTFLAHVTTPIPLDNAEGRRRFRRIVDIYHELKKAGQPVPHPMSAYAADFGLTWDEYKSIQSASCQAKQKFFGPTSDDMIAKLPRLAA